MAEHIWPDGPPTEGQKKHRPKKAWQRRHGCQKVAYQSRLVANNILVTAMLKHRPESRIYWCTECKAWHLTSRP
jgi:hypothetical protein